MSMLASIMILEAYEEGGMITPPSSSFSLYLCLEPA